MSNMFVGWHMLGRDAAGGDSVDYLEDCSFCWVLWPPAVLHPLPLLRNTQNQKNTVCFINYEKKKSCLQQPRKAEHTAGICCKLVCI